MGQITADQSHAVMSALATNVVWANIDFEGLGLQDAAIRDAKEAGRQFEAFLRNGCRLCVEEFFRETPDLGARIIQIPAQPQPTLAELQSKFDWIKRIETDTSPTGPVTLVLGTVLKPGENSINGAEYQRRRLPKIDICLGFQHAQWLVEHQDEFPELMALLGKIYIDFTGLVVVSGGGNRYFPYLRRDGGRWKLHWDNAGSGLFSSGRVAASRK